MNKKKMLIFGGSKGIGGVFTKQSLEKYDITLFSRTNPYSFNVNFIESDFCSDDFCRILNKISQDDDKIDYLVFFLKYRGGIIDNFSGEIAVELTMVKNALEILETNLNENASIVFVSSICGSLIAKNQPLGYHVAKAGLEQITRYYALNFAKKGIRVNAVAPSLTLKPENEEFYNEQKGLVELYKMLSPLGRIGKSEDVCEVIEFLLNCSFVNGQIIRVDGGISIQEYETLVRSIAEFYNKAPLQK
ncbi:3-oxoacyl-ACP reductase [Helicobacter valdiviensis]|uniref:3-oxoacyl-ACP reductase n=1 Tax=Helicobacter valdiviensis TaxID=1458358 RepID=A0A2W6MZ75_9HELI|nr:SDR family oxidoreductase [Helicobacter valdiviensis]PZT48638.1 3-oxoacyl-ACP reductase [Helicobacter valdiviensis]